jgi:predicted DNA-binding transcriptional regulator AlpA
LLNQHFNPLRLYEQVEITPKDVLEAIDLFGGNHFYVTTLNGTAKLERGLSLKHMPSERKEDMSDRFITRKEVAEILGVSIKTLDRWALLGKGPRYRKFGNPNSRSASARYLLRDVFAWAERQAAKGEVEE